MKRAARERHERTMEYYRAKWERKKHTIGTKKMK